jgi:hypothetical protein
MSTFKASIAIASILTLSAGVTFADNLHPLAAQQPKTGSSANPGAASAAPGQTGSNVLSSCGSTEPAYFSVGAGAKSNVGVGSPFSTATKKYAGNPGNPATNPNAVAQYDNACAQAAAHSGQLP